MSPTPQKVFIIGGTGAQGIPVIRALLRSNTYTVRVLTRDPSSRRAQELLALGPSVELHAGDFTSEAALRTGYAGCTAAFVNIDGFNVGEKGELFWAMRAYELAVADGGILFFVYGNLEYMSKLAGYDPAVRAGHYDGKGRAGEWMVWQAAQAKAKDAGAMRVALFTTGPYMEMAVTPMTIMAPVVETDDAGLEWVTWRVPLTEEGAVAHVALDDCGEYVRWLFDHPERADGMDLAVAIEHMAYANMAAAFTKVTGRPARFIDVGFDEYWRDGPMSSVADRPAGYGSDAEDPASMTFRTNFTGFWHIWRRSGGNKGLQRRDYALLDEILPSRIKSAEEWFARAEEKARAEGSSLFEKIKNGGAPSLLKLQEDGFRKPVLK